MQSEANSRLGFIYPQDTYQQTRQDLRRWLDQVSDLPASWVLVQADTERAVPEPFLKGLMEAGWSPIVHIPCPVGSVRPDTINPLLYSYAHWGLHHVIVYDRPNLRQSWAGNSWTNSNLTDRFVDAMLPLLQASFSAGLSPTLPPLEPGGDYWDTAFLKSTLKALSRRGQRQLIDSLVLTAYAPAAGNSIEWGKGGPAAWPQARPYFTPEDSQDHRGFRIYEWYRAIASETLGKARPVLSLQLPAAAGAENKSNKNSQIAQVLHDPGQAQGLQAFFFDQVPSSENRDGWLPDEASHAPDPVEKTMQVDQEAGKRLAHYLLLPSQEQAAVPLWRRASAFALTHQPVVGFSVEEACLARRVTIAADFHAIPAEVEDKLQAAGCQVERLSLLPQRKSACQVQLDSTAKS